MMHGSPIAQKIKFGASLEPSEHVRENSTWLRPESCTQGTGFDLANKDGEVIQGVVVGPTGPATKNITQNNVTHTTKQIRFMA